MDPLLKELIANNDLYKSHSGQLFFCKKYDADVVIGNFTKLKNMILTTQEDFIEYCCDPKVGKLSDHLFSEFSKRS